MIFISKISKHWINYCKYELYFGVNFGNVKNVKQYKYVKNPEHVTEVLFGDSLGKSRQNFRKLSYFLVNL